ncbi:MAG: methionyl-tRNA formyltransferase [Synergistaceae bacterium]|jgi:methionyl-tRNA formyltransferase|nr:methionyl-tRNA formyltransferase [Synergistaceae bacterium]
MKLWFVGSGSFAALCLTYMSRKLFFDKIVTGCPTTSGRGLEKRPSRVEEAAVRMGLIVERTGPLSQNEEIMEAISADPPDLIFVVDFGQLIKEPLLNAARHGCLNIHPSLLPRWRGAAPIPRALMNGDAVTGVTLFRLTEKMDAGPILRQVEIPVDIAATSDQLYESLAFAGSEIACRGVQSLLDGSCRFLDQNSEFATYADKISKTEAQISWTQNSLQIHNTVRAFAFSSGAFVVTGGGRLKLWRTLPVEVAVVGSPGEILCFIEGEPVVACSYGALRLQEVQAEGRRRMSGADWACGGRLRAGEVLT